jgi:hypothetical protein
LLDTQYFMVGAETSAGDNEVPAPPRTYGVSSLWRF